MQTIKTGRHAGRDIVLFKSIGYPLVFIFALLCLLPFLIVLSSSFTSESYIVRHGYSLWPHEFSLESYQTLLQSPQAILRVYAVTITVTAAGTVVGTFINTMTGYVLNRKDFKWRNKFSFFFFFTTLFSGGLMPWYILCVRYLHLSDTIFAMILPPLVSVWYILLVKGFMSGLPFEIVESAKIDGAGDFNIFLRLIFPLSAPVVASIALFTALTYWND